MNEKKNYVRKSTTTFNSQIKTVASFAPILKIVIFVLLDVWVLLYVKCRIFIIFLLLSINYERLITELLNEVYFFSRRFRIRQNMHLVRVYWSRKYKCTTPSLLKLRYIAVLCNNELNLLCNKWCCAINNHSKCSSTGEFVIVIKNIILETSNWQQMYQYY